jgi:hypothetical protein
LGLNDTIITVSYSGQFISGNIQVRAQSNCSISNYTSSAVTRKITTTPGLITGTTDACPLMATSMYGYYSIAAVLNATSYNWSGPSAFSSTVQNPTILNASIANTGNYIVYGTNAGCNGPSSSTLVVVNQTPNPTIQESIKKVVEKYYKKG